MAEAAVQAQEVMAEEVEELEEEEEYLWEVSKILEEKQWVTIFLFQKFFLNFEK